MIVFIDGPAQDVELRLLRTPVMLRVVEKISRDRRGLVTKWDALDQPTDVADRDELIHVYQLAGHPFRAMFDWHDGRGRRGGQIINARYRYLEEQPADHHVRDNAAWAAWCEANMERLLALRAAAERSPNGDHLPRSGERTGGVPANREPV